jgi:3',5'-cyclic AMP phosphodiesterase CpdA
MRKILHMSDLHFGCIDQALLAPLHALVQELRPDLIAVSGDLTQRARSREFEAARDFLASLPAPKVVVPGNHDIPLYNVSDRFARPLARYARYLGDVLEPAYVDAEMVVAGVNTARSLAFKGGRISHEQVARVRALFCGASDQVTKIIVTHHPFDLPEGYHARNLVGRSQMALSELRECPPDLLLSGHLHLHRISSTSTRYDLGGKSAIVVQAGTVISTRGRGETNSFNLVRIQPPEIVIERFDWASERRAFETGSKSTFSRRGGDWVCSDQKTFI